MMIEITVVYMGGSRSQSGCERESLKLAGGATVAQAAEQVVQRHPALSPYLPSVRWAKNYEFAAADDTLQDGDELALLPPVAGGTPRTRLTTEPIDAGALVHELSLPSVGATVLFVGTVRNHSRNQAVTRLEYEAYGPMAERQLERIAADCCQDHGGVELAIVHRFGRLEVGEVSVAIAAAAPHRDAAFAACRQAIERIKEDVPIWKREIAADGDAWVGWGGG